eukprot:5163036-Prymnesium_polylepis.1
MFVRLQDRLVHHVMPIAPADGHHGVLRVSMCSVCMWVRVAGAYAGGVTQILACDLDRCRRTRWHRLHYRCRERPVTKLLYCGFCF